MRNQAQLHQIDPLHSIQITDYTVNFHLILFWQVEILFLARHTNIKGTKDPIQYSSIYAITTFPICGK